MNYRDVLYIKISSNGIYKFLALMLVIIFMLITPISLFANTAPIATDDNITGEENKEITLTYSDLVDPNDMDPDGDILTFLSVSNPTNGTVTLNENGTITFIPDPGFVGEANFTYTIVDRVVIDTSIPVPVIELIDSKSEDNVTTDNPQPEINGTCEAGYTVSIQIDTVDILPTAVCSAMGTFSIIPTVAILEGTHEVTSTQVSTDNRVSTVSTSKTLIVDILNPDYTPTIILGEFNTTTIPYPFTFVVTIENLIDGSTNLYGDVLFSIPKMSDTELTFDSNETNISNIDVENSLWAFSETDDSYIWTYIGNNGIFPSSSIVGISGLFSTYGGIISIDVTVHDGTGEIVLDNNEANLTVDTPKP